MIPDTADGVSWESREGGWQGASVWQTDALLFDEIGLDLPRDSCGDLRDALLNALPSTDWSQRDPYGYSDEEYLRYSWDSFCELIKFRNRFFFVNDPGDGELLDANQTLQKISDLCSEHGLIMDLLAGTRLFRSRPVKGDLKERARKKELKAWAASEGACNSVKPNEPGRHCNVLCQRTSTDCSAGDRSEIWEFCDRTVRDATGCPHS